MTTNPGRESWYSREGAPFPLGATWIPEEQAYNFALFSNNATDVTLLLFGDTDLTRPAAQFRLDHLKNKSGRIWHCRIPKSAMNSAKYYAYSVAGPPSRVAGDGHAFDPQKVLLDPYATSVFFPKPFNREAAILSGSNLGHAALGVLYEDEPPFDWEGDHVRFHEHDLIIYEMHVRGFTRSPTSGFVEPEAGTFKAVIKKIPYLKSLGVTAVELMPVHQFDPQEGNYWGYMTLNFFAPHDQYAIDRTHAHTEFRELVRALHAADIEVILDVVFNHTAEGDHRGPCYSFKGIDNSTYYMISDDPTHPYLNYSGTGNTLHCRDRYVSRMILDSLRHWVTRCHVDGFRFDLASVFTREADGRVNWGDSPLVSMIRSDPVLGKVRLIAEPWDASGLNNLGISFPGKRWMQWNDRFRDEVRRFVRGDPGLVPALMYRLYGSDDQFPDSLEHAYHPYQSVNYINSHDGFSLYDLVSYNERHNWDNHEGNRDGTLHNFSWNCGHEGDKDVPADVLALRKQQAKNFFALLMLSNGTPMFRAGDEFLKTQGGNNNPYNQDNETTWLDWRRYEQHQDIFRFFRLMIAFRKEHPTLARSRFWRADVRWYGTDKHADLSHESRHLAVYLDGASQEDADLYFMINAHPKALAFKIQEFAPRGWRLILDTSRPSPDDIHEPGTEPYVARSEYEVQGRSVVLLMRPHQAKAARGAGRAKGGGQD